MHFSKKGVCHKRRSSEKSLETEESSPSTADIFLSNEASCRGLLGKNPYNLLQLAYVDLGENETKDGV